MSGASHRRAVGIAYREVPGETPSIVVQSSAVQADEAVRIARRFGIPVVDDSALARSLSALELDSEIPPSLFKAVAIILSRLNHSN